jgi:hypothetical protein
VSRRSIDSAGSTAAHFRCTGVSHPKGMTRLVICSIVMPALLSMVVAPQALTSTLVLRRTVAQDDRLEIRYTLSPD